MFHFDTRTHTRRLTRLRGYERVKRSGCPQLRPPAALPGRHHAEAGPTPGSAPSFAFTGHLGNSLDYPHPQGCPWAKVPKDAAACWARAPLVSCRLLDGRLCPRGCWEHQDQFQESHCWVKGCPTCSRLDASATACHEAPPGAGGLPRTPLEAEGEDAGSSRQGAREKPGSGQRTEAWVAGSAAVFTFSSQECRCFAHFLLDSYFLNLKKLEPLCFAGVNVN